MISEEQLNTWQALCEAATPGPWFWDDGDPKQVLLSGYDGEELPGFPMLHVNCGILTLIGYDDEALADEMREPDKAFIAAARVALPALLAEVRRLRAAL